MFQSSISFVTVIFLITPKAHYSSYTMAKRIQVKAIAEAEAKQLRNHSRLMDFVSPWYVRYWRRDQATILSGELKMSAKRTISLPSIPN